MGGGLVLLLAIGGTLFDVDRRAASQAGARVRAERSADGATADVAARRRRVVARPRPHLRLVPPAPPPGVLGPELIAVLGHELRAPLAALRVTVEVLGGETDLAAAGDHVRRLERSVGWLEGLVENLTLWAQMENGDLALETKPTRLRGVVEDAAALVAPVLERKRQHVRVICPDVEPLVMADERRLGRVVINLLMNAGAYGPEGQDIEAHVGCRAGWAEIRVVDRGPGVPPRERERIWERYTRGRAAKTGKTPGMGLGLHLVREIVGLHGGMVGVDAAPGGGASFWVRLPIVRDPAV
jgi:signal transduction histidine kinase